MSQSKTISDFEDSTVAIEPPTDSKTYIESNWPSVQLTRVVGDELKVVNNSSEPIHLKKNEHFCEIRTTLEIDNLSDIPSKIAPKQTVDVPSSSTLFSCDSSV